MANYVDPPNGVWSRGKHYFSMWQTLFEIDTKYVPIKVIGRGAYGIVPSSINQETNETVAIKRINNVFDNRIDSLRTLWELKLLRHLRHENVIALKDVMVPSERRSFKDVYPVYKLMDTTCIDNQVFSWHFLMTIAVFSISGAEVSPLCKYPSPGSQS
ncbi:hypothetical protein IFM89_027184, partial [Coptis chinensis]